jgi:signal transduction histidine kinase
MLVFGGFGLVGSAALVWWVLADAAAVSRQDFLSDGRSNAAFISNTGLPASAKMARQLGEVLGVEVRFRVEEGQFIPPLSETPPWKNLPPSVPTETVVTHAGWELLAIPLRSGQELWLARLAKPAWHGILRPGALSGLAVFWVALLVLAAGISRTVVRPVRALARILPDLSGDNPLIIPKVARWHDEIGSLAEGLAATHAQLVSERRMRLESERLALLGRMAAGLAHEINNPAAAIRLHAQLLARALPADSASGQSALTIASESGRIEELVNQWLFLTRPAPPQISRVPLRPLLEESLAAAAPAAEHAGVSLTILGVPDEAAVPGDSRRLRQVLGNLLTNAIHASTEGGTVTFEVRSTPGPKWEILCRDSGNGFSTEALTKGTELFFSEKEGGLGIGLSVSTEIAAAHGGSLLLSNAPSGGVVTLLLPVA